MFSQEEKKKGTREHAIKKMRYSCKLRNQETKIEIKYKKIYNILFFLFRQNASYKKKRKTKNFTIIGQ